MAGVQDYFWHAMSEPHENGWAEGVELMDVSGRIYQAPGKVMILDGQTFAKPIKPDCKAFAWRIQDGR